MASNPTFTPEECSRAREIESMAEVPKGKPSPEQKAKMDEQKKTQIQVHSAVLCTVHGLLARLRVARRI